MTHPLPPDLTRFPTLLAPPRTQRLAVCLCGTTALSPPLSVLAAMLVSLAQGASSQAAFPEAVLAPGRRWSLPFAAAANPAPRCEATPHVQRRPADDGCDAAAPAPAGLLPKAAATPHAQRQPPVIAIAPAEPTVTDPPRVTATPHVQRQTPAPPPASPAQPLACDAPPPAGAPAREHPMPSGSRGRLKNGAPGGDYLAAPRCGARTRAGGSCLQPAMPNGRCRLHGGKSTGARTEAGRDRLRSIHTRHGGYSQEALAGFRRVNAFIAETRQLLEACRRMTAVAAAVPPAAGGPSGHNPTGAEPPPTPGGAPNA